jgi:hypothetical protein
MPCVKITKNPISFSIENVPLERTGMINSASLASLQANAQSKIPTISVPFLLRLVGLTSP